MTTLNAEGESVNNEKNLYHKKRQEINPRF